MFLNNELENKAKTDLLNIEETQYYEQGNFTKKLKISKYLFRNLQINLYKNKIENTNFELKYFKIFDNTKQIT